MWVGVALLVGACRNNPENCDLNDLETRGNQRAVVSHKALQFEFVGGKWIPSKVIRYTGLKDRSRSWSASETVALYDHPGGRLLGEKEVEGLISIERHAMAAIQASVDLKDISKVREKLLDGMKAEIELPEGEGNWIQLKADEAEPGSVASLLPNETQWIDLSTLKVEDEAEQAISPGLFSSPEGLSADFPFEVLQWSGDPRKKLNLVFLSDGYQKDELGDYKETVNAYLSDLFGHQEPYGRYQKLINVIRIDVPSQESGASCDDYTFSPRKNRYGSSFPVACINAIFKTKLSDRFLYTLKGWRVKRDSRSLRYDGISIADEVAVIVNSPKRGGTGLGWIVQTSITPAHVMAHEFGHTWANLGDEYVNDGDLCLYFMRKRPNISVKKRSISKLKWGHWMLEDTPLPTPATELYANRIGMFRGAAGGCKRVLYRPAQKCKMEGSANPHFCAVCMEAMTLRILDRVSLIESSIRVDETGTLQADVALPERMVTRWFVDGKLWQQTQTYQPLTGFPRGSHEVRLVVADESAPVRKDRCLLGASQVRTITF